MSTDAYIDEVFGELGLLAQQSKDYEPRQGQIDVARAVHASFETGSNLLAEAGTGVGKSYAYSVPATWWAAKENDARSKLKLAAQKVVIVTANIALQEQLVGKDLPRLQQLLPWKFSFAIMKGMQNFLCLDRFEESGPEQLLLQGLDRQQVDQIARWRTTTKKGDLSELPFEVGPRIKPLVVIGQDDCTGKACPHFKECFSKEAKRVAAEADVVVTNYHMFFLDLQLRAETEQIVGILPEYQLVVFDEAHKAADIAREFFGFRLTRGMVRASARLLNAKATPRKMEIKLSPELRVRIEESADRYFAALAKFARSEQRIREPGVVREEARELGDLLSQARILYIAAQARGGWDPGRKTELGHVIRKVEQIGGAIAMATKLEGDAKGNVYFIETQGERASLVMKPLSIADQLRENLFESSHVQAVAMTSATLTASGRFDFIATELGAEDAEEMIAESPFDWAKQCVLVQPNSTLRGKQVPLPTQDTYADVIAQSMVDVAELAGGRMLGLFTSYRVLEKAHKAFMERGWADRVMRQGEQPRMQLVQRLKDELGAVLLGTESFWAGIDIPGEALSVVAIDRLPFPSPDDPLLSAYEDLHGSRTFKDYSMPRAVIALRQGFGRLIRTTSDVGAVVVFDRRLCEKPFGKSFLKSLPREMKMSRDLRDVARVLGRPVPEQHATMVVP